VVHDQPSGAGSRFELRQLRRGATTLVSLQEARRCGFEDLSTKAYAKTPHKPGPEPRGRSGPILPSLPHAHIHQGAWKGYSRKSVPCIAPVQHLWAFRTEIGFLRV
jgi:hypothetical protein